MESRTPEPTRNNRKEYAPAFPSQRKRGILFSKTCVSILRRSADRARIHRREFRERNRDDRDASSVRGKSDGNVHRHGNGDGIFRIHIRSRDNRRNHNRSSVHIRGFRRRIHNRIHRRTFQCRRRDAQRSRRFHRRRPRRYPGKLRRTPPLSHPPRWSKK